MKSILAIGMNSDLKVLDLDIKEIVNLTGRMEDPGSRTFSLWWLASVGGMKMIGFWQMSLFL